MEIGIQKTLSLTWDQALEAVPAALKTEGFGILTRIDIQSTFKEKLGLDFRRYTILGACNPSFAHRALTGSIDAGLLLPCNVVLYEDDSKTVQLRVVDPAQTMGPALGADFQSLVDEVKTKLQRVVAQLPSR